MSSSFDIKRFMRLKKMEEAREKRRNGKKVGSQNSPGAGNNANHYANGHRSSTQDQAAKRLKNKVVITNRVRLMIKNNPHDLYGMKWKVRHICRWNDEHQRDPADALTLGMAGLAELWRQDFEHYDSEVKAAEGASFTKIFRKKPSSTQKQVLQTSSPKPPHNLPSAARLGLSSGNSNPV